MNISFKIQDHSAEVKQAAEKQIAKAVKDIAAAYVKNAQANVPVDTGALRDSISYDTEGDKATVGSNLDYAVPVEMRDVSHRVGKAHFLRDAGQDNTAEYERIAREDLKE